MTEGLAPQREAVAPPGWYPAPDGQVRWWSGSEWHQAYPERPLDPRLAALPHLGMFALPVVAPLALRLTLGSKDEFIKHHCTEALNVQIWFVALWNLVGVPMYVFVMFSEAPGVSLFLTVWLTMAGLFVLTGVFSAIGAWKAYRMLWWRYPITPYRFVRGARPRHPKP